jgi:hypothetical protein
VVGVDQTLQAGDGQGDRLCQPVEFDEPIAVRRERMKAYKSCSPWRSSIG